MGDPKKIRKKYQTPRHPWQKARIEEEGSLLKEYGTKNKKEIWKMQSKLRDFSDRAKRLIAAKTPQAEKEKKELLLKLQSMGLISLEAGLDGVLSLTLRDIMERRLETLIYKKNLARSMKQARQFIVHGHVMVGDKKINSPSYIVSIKEEGLIRFTSKSKLNDPEHPERVMISESAAKKKAKKMEERKQLENRRGRDKRSFSRQPRRDAKKSQAAEKTEKPKKEEKGNKQ
ncbi:30S ribosomal protein S4 [Candidatus Woesearchaeota archaeon CG10_big_fil_rev_8_21_14_0_10_44_13]|nr:MAG: 30S ribosomal protein S4 [Candidatus Woesearchaeota archaeon CG10_big_fil_rev_8_21_14_0_10_44_13]